jgi:hypothetical protein
LTISPNPSTRIRGGSVASVCDVADDRDRLVERPDEVLALRQVDAGLAADRRVDLREQRGRHLQHRDPTPVRRRREAREVADDPAADGDDEVVAGQRHLGGGTPDAREDVHALGGLAVGDEVARHLEARVPSAASTGATWPAATTGVLRDHQRTAGPPGSGTCACRARRAPHADDHRVAAPGAEPDLDPRRRLSPPLAHVVITCSCSEGVSTSPCSIAHAQIAGHDASTGPDASTVRSATSR